MADVDSIAATDLVLFIQNDGQLYRQQYDPIIKNLNKKVVKKIYDREKSLKLWVALVDNGAKKYAKESGGTAWNIMFNVPTRKAAARELRDHFEEYYMVGGSLLHG